MSMTTETEGLLREKAQLKKTLQDVEDEEKYLGEKLRIIEEKLEIQGLREKIRAKRVVVDQLKSKIRELEGRLKEPQKSEPVEVMVKEAPQDSQQSENQKEKKRQIFFP